jgi:predicted nucleic acid-binding protein
MSDRVLIDTDILIDVGRNVKEAVVFLQQQQSVASLVLSTVTEMELIVGCQSKSELRALEQFLQRFQIIKINEQISAIAVDVLKRYRLSHGLLIADAFIAAT